MESATSVKQRSTVLNNLSADERALERTAESAEDLLRKISSLRQTREEYEQSKLLGGFLKEIQSIVKNASRIVKESQTHVRASFTPVEELQVIAESALAPDENISEAAEEGEVVIYARSVPLVLLLHTRAVAEEMADTPKSARTAHDFEKLIMNNIAGDDFLTLIEGSSESDDSRLNKEIIQATVALYRALTTASATEATLKEVTDIKENFVFNRKALEAFLRIYLISVIDVLKSVEDKSLFFSSLPKVITISDPSGETDYSKDLSTERQNLVNESLKAAVLALQVRLKKRTLGEPGLLRRVFDSVKESVKAGAQRAFSPEVKQAEQRVKQVKQGIVGEPNEDELRQLENVQDNLQDTINELEGRRHPEPVEGVHNITVEDDTRRFMALYSLGTKREFDAGDQPFYQTYKALTYAAYLLKNREDIEELMTMEDMRSDNQPDYSKLFDLLTDLTVGFLARKPSTEPNAQNKRRYEIDIDTRPADVQDGELVGPTAVTVTVERKMGRRTATMEEIRGFTALDGFTLGEMYLTYVTAVRAALDYFLAQNLDASRLSPRVRRSIDRFLESHYSFPYPLFNIYAISKDSFEQLKQNALQGVQLIPSADEYPKIDRNENTDTDAAIRFRMYTDSSKQTAEAPKNILRVMALLQASAPNVWDVIQNNISDLQSLGLEESSIRRLGSNWLTSQLIQLAKTVTPQGQASRQRKAYLMTSIFSDQSNVAPTAVLPETYVLFDPQSIFSNLGVSDATFRSYSSALQNERLVILPSQSHANRKKHEKKKKKKKADHDEEWQSLRCIMHDAILRQDRAEFITALNTATSKIDKEVKKGATEEDLADHIKFIRDEMDLAARFGLGGADVMKAMKSASSACSRCPACKRKGKRNGN